MKAVQLKMARAAVGWGVRELADRAGVTANTVTRIENGADAKQSTIEAIRAALEDAGIEFTNGGQPGVRMKLQTWWEQHLTPRGWVKGRRLLEYGRVSPDEAPADTVLTIRTDVIGAGDERTFPVGAIKDRVQAEALLRQYPTLLDGSPAPAIDKPDQPHP